MTPTERTKKILSLAEEEAMTEGVQYVGADHILLAILREGESLAATAMVDVAKMRIGPADGVVTARMLADVLRMYFAHSKPQIIEGVATTAQELLE